MQRYKCIYFCYCRPMKGDDVPVKKLKAEPVDEVDAALNKNIEKQNKVFHKHKYEFMIQFFS